jgi:hypothetical protein
MLDLLELQQAGLLELQLEERLQPLQLGLQVETMQIRLDSSRGKVKFSNRQEMEPLLLHHKVNNFHRNNSLNQPLQLDRTRLAAIGL